MLISGAAALVLAGLVPVPAGAQQPAAAPSLVFEKVTVVDVEHGKLLPAQRVVIAGNRIQAVGPMNRVRLPQGAQVVDARGKYLIPGLWDMHTHADQMAHLFYPLFIANGVTGIRDASSLVPLDTLRLWRREILAGTRVGPPRQLLSGAIIQTHCPGIGLGRCTALGRNPDTLQLAANARRIVDSLKSAGADMIKMRDLYPATTYFVIAAEARRLGIPFGGHAWDSIDVEVSNRGASLIDHIEPWYKVPEGFRAWCWTPKPTASLEQCQPVAERFRHNNTWIVPTMTVYVGRSPTTLRTHWLAKRLRERTAEFFGGSLLHGNWIHDSTPSGDTQAVGDKVLPDSLGVLRLMQRTGVPITAGTDAFPGIMQKLPPGFSLHTELAVYVAEGLTPLNALRSATLEPAKMLRATDSLGTVAPGKLADLVLLDADPLGDITNTTTVRAVVANGRYFDRAMLDSLLVEVQTKAKKP